MTASERSGPGDGRGTGTWPLFVGWMLLLLALIVFYVIVGIANG